MSVLKQWKVKRVFRKDIQAFIERWHYSGSINGCSTDFCYALYDEADWMVGAMFFGKMAMAGQYKRFHENENEVIELRRLCCIDNTPKNTESYFIGKALRLLSKDWKGSIVVSYADAEYGHEGTIYKASNFEKGLFSKGAKVIIHNGRRYHDKAIRTKYKGELKPFALRLIEALKTGEASYKETKGKHTYIYRLKK